MPATVKSLEERLDEFSDELDAMKAQLAGLSAKFDLLTASVSGNQSQLASLSAQLAVLTAKFEALTHQLQLTGTRFDTLASRLEALITEQAVLKSRVDANEAQDRETRATVTEHSAFKNKSEQTFALLRWVGGFAAVTLIAVLGTAWNFTNAVSRMDATLQQQQKALDDIRRDVYEIRAKQK